MNILLVNVPSRKGKGGFMLPLGLLYTGSIIEKCNHRVKIIDLYLDDIKYNDSHHDNIFKRIDAAIKDYKPSIIGYGGIATSYGRTKQLAHYIKRKYPNVIQIVGGPLASVYELLLTKAKIDIVFHGETESSLPVFLKKLEKKELLYDTPGISYLLNRKVVRNAFTKQIKNLDKIPFPAYHLIDLSLYLHPVKEWLDAHKESPHYSDVVKKIGKKTHYIPIVASRGCTRRCSFCYRHVLGIKRHSIKYVINHIKYLKKRYGINGFQFCDELFNSDYEWITKLCDAIEKNDLDIFYMIGGARTDKVDEKMLRRLKETGCINIEYGQESGSDIILKEYGKGILSQRNKEITLLTKKVGLNCTVQLVIGSPSETNSTIYETINFLKEVDEYRYSLNYLIPLPETPIWQIVKENKLIPNVEEYLNLVAEYGGAPLINLTKEPNKVWKKWGPLIHRELKIHHYKKMRSNKYYLNVLLIYLISEIEFLIPTRLRRYIPNSIKDMIMKFYYRK